MTRKSRIFINPSDWVSWKRNQLSNVNELAASRWGKKYHIMGRNPEAGFICREKLGCRLLAPSAQLRHKISRIGDVQYKPAAIKNAERLKKAFAAVGKVSEWDKWASKYPLDGYTAAQLKEKLSKAGVKKIKRAPSEYQKFVKAYFGANPSGNLAEAAEAWKEYKYDDEGMVDYANDFQRMFATPPSVRNANEALVAAMIGPEGMVDVAQAVLKPRSAKQVVRSPYSLRKR